MKTTPAAQPWCNGCGSSANPVTRAVIAGIEVTMCVNPSACLNRARVARVGMWAR